MATKKKNLKKSAKLLLHLRRQRRLNRTGTAQAQAPQPDPTALSIGDLKNLSTILDVASTRGAFKANEMAGVGFYTTNYRRSWPKWHQNKNLKEQSTGNGTSDCGRKIMATLMNVNDQAMPMGADSGAGEGATGPKRHFKHIGELVDGGAKVVIMYRTVPGEPDNCLVVGTKFLPDLYHNALMKAVESDGGQDAEEFADFASRQTFPDGTNMLAMMHNDNYIKKFKTKEIMVTFGNTADGRILLTS